MKLSRIKLLTTAAATLFYATSGYAHISGEHSGGFVQQIMHILQNADHLFIILALGIVVSLLLRHVKNHSDK